MSAMFRLDTKGGHMIELKLASLAQAFGDLTPLMDGFGVSMESFILDRFDTETAPDGTPWEPSLRAKTEGGKTLTDTAQLRGSMTSESGSDFAAAGTNKIYAGAHNDGATIRAKSDKGLGFQLPGGLGFRRVMEVELPRRQFLGLGPEDEAELVAQAEDYAITVMGPTS